MRIDLDPGDTAEADQLLAVIHPNDPALLDARSRAESQARLESARAAVKQSEAVLKRAEAALNFATAEQKKVEQMYESGAATPKERDDAVLLRAIRMQEKQAALFAAQVARFQMKLAEAALTHTAGKGEDAPMDDRLKIQAPCTGRVLRVYAESEGFVTPGTPLLMFGNPDDLEIVVDVLSTKAVSIRPGAVVRLEHWGGDRPLRGRVRVVEPAAFTKVSSLGVEEQRVNVIIDFIDPPENRRGLGDGYRVEAAIEVWQKPDVLKIPTSALFRHEDRWAVFSVRKNKAVLTPVRIGRRNGIEAQVLEGLVQGDRLVVYPSDRIDDGTDVEPLGP